MNEYLPDAEAFLKHVRDHAMTIVREDGVYRHLRFRKPGTSCMGFDIITWPGYLCFCGDMGTYVFQRLQDMLQFFRTKRRDDGSWSIDHRYWAEKVEAEDKNGGVKEYSEDKFREAVAEYLANRDELPEGLREAVEEEVLFHASEEHEAYRAVHEFEHNGWGFTDFFEYTLTDYTYRFRWCCLALAWAVEMYDAEKAKAPAEVAANG
jgi:hypothetical protein